MKSIKISDTNDMLCQSMSIIDTSFNTVSYETNIEKETINSPDQISIPGPRLSVSTHTPHCGRLNRPIVVMNRYNKYKEQHLNIQNINFMDNINRIQVVNDFLHLINCHNSDEQFEYIFNELGHCDISKCKRFRRNNRNRAILNDVAEPLHYQNKENIVWYQIMDKIHCHFQHCYDIGNRLFIKDQITVNEFDINENENKSPDQYLINNKIIKIKTILAAQQKQYKTIYHGLCDRINIKYNQLFANKYQQQSEEYEMYSFGHEFRYGYDGEEDLPNISPKYSSLKTEMIHNDISRMAVKQFDNENAKAIIHFNSHYRKSRKEWHNMKLEHLLSLMIHCNYTELQYQFNKTCRID
eukprot:17539_1